MDTDETWIFAREGREIGERKSLPLRSFAFFARPKNLADNPAKGARLGAKKWPGQLSLTGLNSSASCGVAGRPAWRVWTKRVAAHWPGRWSPPRPFCLRNGPK